MSRSWSSVALLAAALAVGTALGLASLDADAEALAAPDEGGLDARAAAIDARMTEAWTNAAITPAPVADELTVVRRLSLALTGTIPSLEELRALEKVAEGDRVDRHLENLLRDRRYADHLAERLARAFVGTAQGPFLVFRRRRFVSWLSDALAEGRPYDRLVREMVGGNGLWTDKPGTNFITGHARDPVQLTARTTRAFLGMRLDCAQCHDHPFSHWKQQDFAQLAAFYGGIRQTVTGIEDSREPFRPTGRMMMMDEAPAAEPAVPFAHDALPPADQSLRRRLASWLTSPDNPAFSKAIANRIWTILLGRSLTHGGVDDIESDERVPGVLQLLADDFVAHDHDLRRLIRVITRTTAFRTASTYEKDSSSQRFASFPLVKLRAEQIAGSLVQLGNLHTIDAESHVLWRLVRFGNRQDFGKRYGDAGEQELKEQPGTIMQRLVMMNGRIVRERVDSSIFTAAGRIAALAPNDSARVETLFLIAYTRRPRPEELEMFSGWLAGKKGEPRMKAMEDMLWALVNATEFSWNH
jgi:Protein of unknown function (DUF1549)/Protein of unknown function (DUF1553)